MSEFSATQLPKHAVHGSTTPQTADRLSPNALNTLNTIQAIAELAQLDQWVAWKYVQRRGKVDKPPVNPQNGKIENGNDPSTWGSYAQACACHRSCAGVGFAFHASDPYSGVDLDGCRDVTTGQIAHWAQRWIDALDSYTEISPSGTGVKVFVRGTLPAALKHEMGPHLGIEVYSEKRYFTVTGQHLNGTPTAIQEAQGALDLMWAEYHQEKAPAPARPVCKVSPGEAAAGKLSARETIDGANRRHDLGQLLESHGAQLVRTSGDKRYYSGLQGDQHTHSYTYIVSSARDGNGQVGFCYSSGGTFNKNDYPRGFRWFDAYVALEQGGNVTTALKALNPIARTNSAPSRSLPNYLTPAEAEKRQADRERARTQRRTCSDARMQQIPILAAKLAASKSRAFVRSLWAYHQHRWEDAGAPQHVDSNERIARSVLGLSRPPTANELRRLQLGHERLIAHGYLVRTVRYKKGEQHTNCWQPGDGYMVIVGAGETITMLDHESESYSDSVTCEGGANPQPDRVLLSRVRELAGQVQEPGWYLRDYAELDERALLDEAGRLESLREQRAAGVSAEIPQMDSQFENPVELADGACYIPALDWTAGGRLDLAGWRDPLELRPLELGSVDDQAEPAELLDLTPEPEPLIRSAPTAPAAAREYWALKHKKPVNFKQASWIRHRLAELEIWIPASQALALEPPPTPAIAVRQPRRRAAAAAPLCAQIPVGEQLTLELPMGNAGKPEMISGLSPGARAAAAIGAEYGPSSRRPSQALPGGS